MDDHKHLFHEDCSHTQKRSRTFSFFISNNFPTQRNGIITLYFFSQRKLLNEEKQTPSLKFKYRMTEQSLPAHFIREIWTIKKEIYWKPILNFVQNKIFSKWCFSHYQKKNNKLVANGTTKSHFLKYLGNFFFRSI